jgi:hypothetical protein
MITCWKELIFKEMKQHKESFSNVVKCTLSDQELEEKFDDGWGGLKGKPFTLWTEKRVYFPVQYDGSEWVSSVPRNPCNEETKHVGCG